MIKLNHFILVYDLWLHWKRFLACLIKNCDEGEMAACKLCLRLPVDKERHKKGRTALTAATSESRHSAPAEERLVSGR